MLSDLITNESNISAIVEATGASNSITLAQALGYSVVALILGFIISIAYMNTGKVSKNMARTLVILPVLVCVVMMSVNGNLGAAVAVMGAFSLIRFRSLQGTARDIGFVFLAMTTGICCAIEQLTFATAVTVMVSLVYILLNKCKYGESKTEMKDLRITIPENLDYSEIFDDLLDNYTSEHSLERIKTTNMGTMYELNYHVRLKDAAAEKPFIDDIRCRNGNLTVVLGRMNMNSQEEL